MSFFKKLFGGEKKRPVEREGVRGAETAHSTEEHADTRSRMEAEMTTDRERRTQAAAPGSLTSETLSAPAKEVAVIALVTRACAGRDLQTAKVNVQKLDGRSVPTLRFTLEDRASTDLESERISGSESSEALASEVVAELQRQAGL